MFDIKGKGSALSLFLFLALSAIYLCADNAAQTVAGKA
jgi:hypothetical protein